MDVYQITDAIPVMCVTASAFPQGVQAAHQRLHGLVNDREGRRFFGLSWKEPSGQMTYKAATEARKEGEAEALGCESFQIPAGDYLRIPVQNYMSDIPAIGRAFQQLTTDPRLDPRAPGVELYLNDKEVWCMVKIKSTK